MLRLLFNVTLHPIFFLFVYFIVKNEPERNLNHVLHRQ
jgi:hypothetical protein